MGYCSPSRSILRSPASSAPDFQAGWIAAVQKLYRNDLAIAVRILSAKLNVLEKLPAMMLPPFTGDGLLPPGDYPLTLDELRASHLVAGAGVSSATWDVAWRAGLVDNLEILLRQLWHVGIDRIFVDGSFVEEKDHPNDIDGYFECNLLAFASGALQQALNALDPHQVWTWDPASRSLDPNSTKRQLPMWHHYRVELYPHFPGLLSGIRDQFGNELEFPSAFRLSRQAHRPKGIVRVVR